MVGIERESIREDGRYIERERIEFQLFKIYNTFLFFFNALLYL